MLDQLSTEKQIEL